MTCENRVPIGKMARLSLLLGESTTNQKRGKNGNADGSVASETVPSVSVKWMKNRNTCDTTVNALPAAHQK